MNKPEKKDEVSEDEKWLRGLLCNGTMDCENSPECPEGTDGCVVDDIIKWNKEEIQAVREHDLAEIVKERVVIRGTGVIVLDDIRAYYKSKLGEGK